MLGRFLVNNKTCNLSLAGGASFRELFLENQILILSDFFRAEAFELLKAEVKRMEQFKKRRDLLMRGTGNTPRKMSTLSGTDIDQMSSVIPMLYKDEEFCHFLSAIVGETVYPVPDKIENYVCNFLHQPGDTHGGHIDSYPFAFNIMIEAPPEGVGGVLELVKNSNEIKDLDDIKKVQSVYIAAGDCYLLRTDKAVHRVSPLIKTGYQRTIINFAYANKASLNVKSYSSSILYGQ